MIRPPYISVAILSASALGYEILLMRLFSIIQWHHFAYMIIALALLGYGISGSLLSIIQPTITRHYKWLYPLSLMLFAFTALGGFLIAQSLSFNSEELFWDFRQAINLAIICLLLALPFVFTASAICMTFMVYSGERVSTIYAVDLLGAGIGALGIILVMFLLMPEQILVAIPLAGMAAMAIAIWELNLPFKSRLYIPLMLIALLLLNTAPRISLSFSPYKGLMQTLQIKGTRVVDQYSSPLGYLTLVASDEMPLRHAPGLSLINPREPPQQLGLFSDADNMSAVTRFSGDIDALSYLDRTTSALPYHLRRPAELLVIGSGTGADLLLARYHQVESVDALELNPQLVGLLRNDYKTYAGEIYDNPSTRLHIAEARDFLGQSEKKYDLIQIALVDAASASSSGLYALNESYLYTQEALALYLSHLAPDGYLAITRWIKVPPRDSLKLFLTAHQAMESLGLGNLEQRLLLIRNWQTATLLVKNGTFTSRELALADTFCKARLFDTAYSHRLTEAQANRYNRLREPYFYRASKQIVSGEKEQLLASYKFDLQPASDDKPYFHHFFRWESFFEALKLRHQGGMPLIEWGYIILILTLVITVLLSALLILLPLSIISRNTDSTGTGVGRWRVFYYFFCIGVAFLFIEIATIQKFIRFLHHPIYAISVSLAGFLLFAGLGSFVSERLARLRSHYRIAALSVFVIASVSLGYLFLLEPLFAQLGHLAMAYKFVISSLLIAPLAFFMGMPFPLAISSLKQQTTNLIPWAWGINGYASVISAGLATLIAIDFGFTTVILIAILLYLSILPAFPALLEETGHQN
ncbi:MAG: SAM-dependent methyltransferase [Candidatus Thiodiazotropha sp. (ex Ctena orbiculata)]|nr:SAM-dependent methyltransferase [Candidatus Thiodiazotropha taylori]MBT2996101.1 SAM-dependent methyltransferase [Candidatus Thiodiazotropha taylori]MBT2999755.1 SAM-dependent methyltransferase [Candidatus Thiodiazotropha taylori]MBV2106398.1 SAM-dependent methyltransferase [Candidatus Thiodiazotropha taylori]MBV2110530.1 SAM-dependent methyltransferase [Candidatus Thiodiazotropha taylori]